MKYYPVKISTSVWEPGSAEVCPWWTVVTYIINDSRWDTSGNTFVQLALYKTIFGWHHQNQAEGKRHILPVNKSCRDISGKVDQCLPLLQLPVWVPLDKLSFSRLCLPHIPNKGNTKTLWIAEYWKVEISWYFHNRPCKCTRQVLLQSQVFSSRNSQHCGNNTTANLLSSKWGSTIRKSVIFLL